MLRGSLCLRLYIESVIYVIKETEDLAETGHIVTDVLFRHLV